MTHLYFFFQAEDGIRDPLVTGVQTCALPISGCRARDGRESPARGEKRRPARRDSEIGRASCRERVEISVVAGSLKRKRGKIDRYRTMSIGMVMGSVWAGRLMAVM